MNGYVQDERYFAIEHMDVRREAFQDCTAYQCGIFLHLVLTDPRRHGGIPSETRREYVPVGLGRAIPGAPRF